MSPSAGNWGYIHNSKPIPNLGGLTLPQTDPSLVLDLCHSGTID